MRLGRQMIAECLVLAMIAGALSLLVANWTLTSMFSNMPSPLLGPISSLGGSIDGRVIVFNIVLILAAGLSAGILGSSRLSRSSLNDVVKGGSPTQANQKLRSLFTVAEVALAVMLLAGSVVMIQSVQRLLHVDPGFRTDHVVSMRLSLPASQYP